MKVLRENEYAKIWKTQGVVFCKFKMSIIDLQTAKECVRTRLAVVKNKYHLMCSDMTDVTWAPIETRRFFATPYAQKYVKAAAIIVGNPVTKIIGNFFLYLSKPTRPARIFTDIEKAVAWLKKTDLRLSLDPKEKKRYLKWWERKFK